MWLHVPGMFLAYAQVAGNHPHANGGGDTLTGQARDYWMTPNSTLFGSNKNAGGTKSTRDAPQLGIMDQALNLVQAPQPDHGTKGRERLSLTGDAKEWPSPKARDFRDGRSNRTELTHLARFEYCGRDLHGTVIGDLPVFPPGPNDREQWARILEVAPALEPAIRGMANELAYRMDQLRILGNGVFPLAGAVALHVLAARLGIEL